VNRDCRRKIKEQLNEENTSEKNTESLSTVIEKILVKASKDMKFREVFFRDRTSVIESPEFSMNHHDKMLLSSIPVERLKNMIDSFSRQDDLEINPERNRFCDSPVKMARSAHAESPEQGRPFAMGIRPEMLEKYRKQNRDNSSVTRGIRPDF